ncbi:MAG: ZIP family metal transporter [Salinirussus sp.]
MADATTEFDVPDAGRLFRALVPLLLLGVAIVALFTLPLFSGVQSGEPLPDITVSHVTLPHDEQLILHVTNNGPEPVTISQILVDEAYWDFTVGDGGPGAATLAPLESSTITIPYHWTPGWDLHVTIVLADGATFGHDIIAPHPQPGITPGILWSLAVIGLFVGVIPIALGMLWFPAMQNLSRSALHGLLALAAGVLTFLAFDAGFEAFEVATAIPGAFEGELLVVTAIIGTLLVIQAVTAALRENGELSPLGLAYLVALAIGLHNLAEGLAIGGAFALGRASLGAFLVLGFMVHNVTEGPAVVAPLAEGRRPKLWHFGALGVLAGAPVILGGWIGSVATSPTVGAVFLAAGVGAILQVNWEIADMIRTDGRLTAFAPVVGFLVGLVVMYATDLLVAL